MYPTNKLLARSALLYTFHKVRLEKKVAMENENSFTVNKQPWYFESSGFK